MSSPSVGSVGMKCLAVKRTVAIGGLARGGCFGGQATLFLDSATRPPIQELITVPPKPSPPYFTTNYHFTSPLRDISTFNRTFRITPINNSNFYIVLSKRRLYKMSWQGMCQFVFLFEKESGDADNNPAHSLC